MRIEASVDRSVQHIALSDEVASVKLIAETDGERKHLAVFYKALIDGATAVINMPIKESRDN